jgi:hypothetical protein
VTLPDGWEPIDSPSLGSFALPGAEALFALAHASHDGSNVSLIRYPLPVRASLDDVEREAWSMYEAMASDLKVESREVTNVDGLRAIRRVHSEPSDISPEGRAYILQYFAVSGRTLFIFTGWTPSSEALARHKDDIETIVASIDLASFAE